MGANARPVAGLARELGVCWWTVMEAVKEHGTPSSRPVVASVWSPSSASMRPPTWPPPPRTEPSTPPAWSTSTVPCSSTWSKATPLLTCGDGVRLRARGGWPASPRWPPTWPSPTGPGSIRTWPMLAVWLTRSTVTRAANRCVDAVRRRVQNETTGHRGHKADPLYRIRKLLLTGSERLDDRGHTRVLLGLRIGDPHDELLGAWLAKESVRDIYLTDDPAEAGTLIDKAIAGCAADEVEEIRSLAKTLSRWRNEIVAHHHTGASNGPTEGLNLLVKKVKRCGHGFRKFENYRLRVLLHAGGVSRPDPPAPPRIRTRSPHSAA